MLIHIYLLSLEESRNVQTVFRDKSGKMRDLDLEREDQKRKAGEQAAKDEKYAQWGRGWVSVFFVCFSLSHWSGTQIVIGAQKHVEYSSFLGWPRARCSSRNLRMHCVKPKSRWPVTPMTKILTACWESRKERGTQWLQCSDGRRSAVPRHKVLRDAHVPCSLHLLT